MNVVDQQKIPRRLPIVRLYLDDIEDITKVFSEKSPGEPTVSSRPVVTYQVGQFHSENLADIAKLGTRLDDFALTVRGNHNLDYRTLRLSTYINSWDTSWASNEYATYEKLLAIFNRRRDRWKIVLRSGPLFAGPLLGLLSLNTVGHSAPRMFRAGFEVATLILILAFLAALVFGPRLAHSVVELRYSAAPDAE